MPTSTQEVDTAGRWPLIEDITADLVYVRLHGDQELYTSGYSAETLERRAVRIEAWREGRQAEGARLASPLPARPGPLDVFRYFDNHAKVHSPGDAIRLARRLGVAATQ